MASVRSVVSPVAWVALLRRACWPRYVLWLCQYLASGSMNRSTANLMKVPMAKQAQLILKRAGLYKTRARLAVLGVLLDACGPMSRIQISAALSDPVDKVTVYRTLTCLANANLVHRAYIENRSTFYELAQHCTRTQCHPHFKCRKCGRILCLFDLKMPKVRRRYRGLVIEHQQIRLEGLCPPCAQTECATY